MPAEGRSTTHHSTSRATPRTAHMNSDIGGEVEQIHRNQHQEMQHKASSRRERRRRGRVARRRTGKTAQRRLRVRSDPRAPTPNMLVRARHALFPSQQRRHKKKSVRAGTQRMPATAEGSTFACASMLSSDGFHAQTGVQYEERKKSP
eukprot:scaffold15145_cov54-Phaeocystis_antarctica.AAC.2